MLVFAYLEDLADFWDSVLCRYYAQENSDFSVLFDVLSPPPGTMMEMGKVFRLFLKSFFDFSKIFYFHSSMFRGEGGLGWSKYSGIGMSPLSAHPYFRARLHARSAVHFKRGCAQHLHRGGGKVSKNISCADCVYTIHQSTTRSSPTHNFIPAPLPPEQGWKEAQYYFIFLFSFCYQYFSY